MLILSVLTLQDCPFSLILVRAFCPNGERTTRTDTYVSRNGSTLYLPARLPATVITPTQTKLRGNLGWEKKKLFEFSISRSACKV